MERWKPVPGYEGLYEVSDQGRIWSVRAMRPKKARLRESTGGMWYWQLDLYGVDRVVTRLVHRLVLEAFAGPCPQGMEAAHNDGDSSNNTLSNLEWKTHRANIQDRTAHGTTARGSLSGKSKLTESAVLNIRADLSQGRSRREMSEKYGVTYPNIVSIEKRKTWRHV